METSARSSADPAPAAACARTATTVGRAWRRLLTTPTPLIFLASLAVAAVLLWRQGAIADLGAAARAANPIAVVAGVALYAVGLALLCLRWQALVRIAGGIADIPLAAEAFLTSVVVNYAAPIGLAVPTRAALSKRDLGLSLGASGAVALWEVALDVLILGLLSLAWLATGGLAILDGATEQRWLVPLLVGIGAAGAIVALAAARRPHLGQRVRLAASHLIRYPARQPRATLAVLGLTVGFWALQAVVLHLLLGAVSLDAASAAPSGSLLLGLLGPPVLIGMLSPVPGGAGVREALMVAVAHAGGVDGAAVLLAAVAYRAALFVTIPLLYAAIRLWRATCRGGRCRRGWCRPC